MQKEKYQQDEKRSVKEVKDADEFYDMLFKLQDDIKTTEAELKEVKKKLKLTPKVMTQKYNKARSSVESLEFNLKELKFKMKNILTQNGCETESQIIELKQYFEDKRNVEIPKLEIEEQKMDDEIQKTLSVYKDTEKQTENLDREELSAERKKIRAVKEDEARKELNVESDNSIELQFNRSVDAASKLIGEEPPHYLTKHEIYQQENYDRWAKEQEERRKISEERRKQYRKNIKPKNIDNERSQ